uniref:Putative secreted protein n=1 Tax=Anopheles darlingi TaxID=43151 RepID=A0A2M4DN94_ANODA
MILIPDTCIALSLLLALHTTECSMRFQSASPRSVSSSTEFENGAAPIASSFVMSPLGMGVLKFPALTIATGWNVSFV